MHHLARSSATPGWMRCCTGNRVGVRAEQVVVDSLQHRARQIRGRFGQGVTGEAVRVDNMGAVIVMTPFKRAVEGELERSNGDRALVRADYEATVLHHYWELDS